MELYLWKSPVTGDEGEAGRLVDRFFDSNDQTVFATSPAIAAVAEELQRLYPVRQVPGDELLASMSADERGRYTEEGLAELLESGSYTQDEGGPWADLPHHQTDSLLVLSIRWGAHGNVLDDIVRLGREHELVIYDPQGPSVYLPDDHEESGPNPSPTLFETAKIVVMVAVLLGLTYAAWQIPIGWIRWPAVVVAGFVASAGVFVLWLTIAAAMGWSKDES